VKAKSDVSAGSASSSFSASTSASASMTSNNSGIDKHQLVKIKRLEKMLKKCKFAIDKLEAAELDLVCYQLLSIHFLLKIIRAKDSLPQ
jgi:hypothetical protein